jgi:hypothetical protein
MSDIDSIPLQYFAQIQPIDRAEGIHAKYRWDGPLVFDIGKARERDDEFIVAPAFSYAKTGIFDVPVAEIQPLSGAFQALAWIVHDMMLSRKLRKTAAGSRKQPLPLSKAVH